MVDGEKLSIINYKRQRDIGLCIDSYDLETNYRLREKYYCVVIYLNMTLMLTADSNNTE